uniref:Uncharacterized protein n=1 Tax=Cucumis melo TaxID=3656 RepID=A0A9I9EFA4_CUCME
MGRVLHMASNGTILVIRAPDNSLIDRVPIVGEKASDRSSYSFLLPSYYDGHRLALARTHPLSSPTVLISSRYPSTSNSIQFSHNSHHFIPSDIREFVDSRYREDLNGANSTKVPPMVAVWSGNHGSIVIADVFSNEQTRTVGENTPPPPPRRIKRLQAWIQGGET